MIPCVTVSTVNHDLETRVAACRGGAVATAHPAATAAAQEIAAGGGNAIDAAVAAAWALSVVEPAGSGLGGQTVVLLRLAGGSTVVVDGHSRAPAAVSLQTVSWRQQRQGHRACAVPSTVATLGFVQSRYGSLPLERVLGPAIRLAEDGFPVTPLYRRQVGWCLKSLGASSVTSRLFIPSGSPPRPGDRFRQPELAETLRRIARFGVGDFYTGSLARDIIQDMEENRGLVVAEDLRRLELPAVCDPLEVDYYNFRVLSAPPPGGGVQLLQGLKLLQRLAVRDAGTDQWYANLAQAVRLVFHDRERSGIRPDSASRGEFERLLSREHVNELVDSLSRSPRAPDSVEAVEASGETTHLCAADNEGNMVALTQSIQSLFGAKVANARLGFLYNNYLKTCPRRAHPHQLGSRCLPRSNAAPTLVLRKAPRRTDGAHDWVPFLILGAAGSRRITSSLLQVISGVLDRQNGLAEALACPRIHGREDGQVRLEKPAATDSLCRQLSQNFGQVLIQAPLSYSMGSVQAIQFMEDGRTVAAADPRRDGTAAILGTAARNDELQTIRT